MFFFGTIKFVKAMGKSVSFMGFEEIGLFFAVGGSRIFRVIWGRVQLLLIKYQKLSKSDTLAILCLLKFFDLQIWFQKNEKNYSEKLRSETHEWKTSCTEILF